jgi:hypothetical protein
MVASITAVRESPILAVPVVRPGGGSVTVVVNLPMLWRAGQELFFSPWITTIFFGPIANEPCPMFCVDQSR